MPEEALIDAPVDTAPLEDAPVEPNEPDTQEPDTTEPDSVEDPAQPAAVEPNASIVQKDGTLRPDVKLALEKIKETDPNLAQEFQRLIRSQAAFAKAFPGSVSDALKLQNELKSVGGSEGLKEMQAETQAWRELDQQFTSGDPKFVESIAAESPEAFLAMVPSALAQFSKIHPDGYSQYVSQVFVSDMRENEVPLMMQRLQDFIGENPKAMEVWGKLAGYLNRINEFATKKVEKPAAGKPQAATPDREAELKQREQELTERDWGMERATIQKRTFDTEFNRLLAGRKITDDDREAIRELYDLRVGKLLRDSGIAGKIKTYFANGDREGYRRAWDAAYKAEIPKALSAAFGRILPASRTAVAKPAAKPTVPNGTAPKPGVGFQWVGKRPGTQEIDMERTNPAMFTSGKAVLKNGRQVQWKR